jgi:hypothetical protein
MKPLAVVALILGVVFLGLTAMYWLTPAGSLPSFLPGYDTTNAAIHHHKHAVGAFVVALVLFAFAWFQSKPAKTA